MRISVKQANDKENFSTINKQSLLGLKTLARKYKWIGTSGQIDRFFPILNVAF